MTGHKTTRTLQERVAAGIALLEQHQPGSTDRIDIESLCVMSSEDCPLGQLYGDFITGARLLGVNSFNGSIDNGFLNDIGQEKFAPVTAEWKRQLTERRQSA